jgi:crotonobetainyl-CoA:carnitine CoA-transferase CaiB-like acyl-CoA transferase
MKLKQLIAEAYEEHLRDHTATADFEVCQNPKCHFAAVAEKELAAAVQERDHWLAQTNTLELALNDAMQERDGLREAAKEALGIATAAQFSLRSTAQNWQESHLFDADDHMTGVISKLGDALKGA